MVVIRSVVEKEEWRRPNVRDRKERDDYLKVQGIWFGNALLFQW